MVVDRRPWLLQQAAVEEEAVVVVGLDLDETVVSVAVGAAAMDVVETVVVGVPAVVAEEDDWQQLPALDSFAFLLEKPFVVEVAVLQLKLEEDWALDEDVAAVLLLYTDWKLAAAGEVEDDPEVHLSYVVACCKHLEEDKLVWEVPVVVLDAPWLHHQSLLSMRHVVVDAPPPLHFRWNAVDSYFFALNHLVHWKVDDSSWVVVADQ